MATSEAQRDIKQGNRFPYDTPDGWNADTPPPPEDWAHSAARGILHNLCDRRGIKRALYEVDTEIKAEITETMAEIIREAEQLK